MDPSGTSLAAIERIYRDSGRDFFRLAYARTGDIDAARDAVQEGFARAIRSRHLYRRSGSLDAWIARCVINAAYDEVRRQSSAGYGDAAMDSEWPAAGVGVEASLVRQAVRQLPERQRDALFLRFYLGFDYRSISETLGIAIGTVSATLHAARASLA